MLTRKRKGQGSGGGVKRGHGEGDLVMQLRGKACQAEETANAKA